MKKIDQVREEMKMSTATKKDFWVHVEKTMKLAGAMKRNMNKRGIFAGKAKCPYCEGFWHARIAKSNGHMHMRCDGTCGTFMME